MDPEKRLQALGVELPAVPKPVAAYVPAVRTGNLVYVSGQLPSVEGELLATGRVGQDVEPKVAAELARQCAINILAALKSQVGDLRNITRVVRVEGFVASAPDFYDQPKVINGASELLGEVFGAGGKHSRIAVGVSVLPLNAPVEVAAVFETLPTKI